jgi:hypothetical protein
LLHKAGFGEGGHGLGLRGSRGGGGGLCWLPGAELCATFIRQIGAAPDHFCRAATAKLVQIDLRDFSEEYGQTRERALRTPFKTLVRRGISVS